MSATIASHRTLQLAAREVGEKANGSRQSLRDRLAPHLERAAITLGGDALVLLRVLASKRLPPTQEECDRAVQLAAHAWEDGEAPAGADYLLSSILARHGAAERRAERERQKLIERAARRAEEADRALVTAGLTAVRRAMALHMEGRTHEARALVVGLDPEIKARVTAQVRNFLSMTEHTR